MSQYTPEQLAEILASHKAWREGKAVGKRADLRGAELDGVSAVIDTGIPDGWRCVGWLKDGVRVWRIA
jgi:hypothetical protein